MYLDKSTITVDKRTITADKYTVILPFCVNTFGNYFPIGIYNSYTMGTKGILNKTPMSRGRFVPVVTMVYKW